MRSAAISALFALAAVQQAAAWGGDWNQCQTLSTPQQADNQCTDDQKQGVDLTTAKLPQGSCNSYQNFDLSGLSYGSFSGNKQRSLFSRNGGSSDNCLKGQASKGSGPSMSCGSGIPSQKASIKNMQVSCDKDTDVQFVHSYAGSDQTCSYTKSLKAGSVNNVDNTQCGGSTAVKCQLPDTSKEESCNVGFHSIAFDCTPGQQKSSSTPQSSPSQVPSSPASSPPESKPTYPVTVPISSAPGKSVTPYFPIPSASAPGVPSKNATTPSVLGTSPAPSVPSQVESSSVPVSSAPSIPVTTAPSEVASSSSPPESTVAEVTSEIVYTTITSCPVTNTKTYGSTTSIEVTTSISTVLITSTKTICTRCVAPPQKTSSVPASPESQMPSPSPAPSQVGSSSGPALPVSSTPPQKTSSVPASPESQIPSPSPAPSQVGSSSGPNLPISSAPPASSASAPPASVAQSTSVLAVPQTTQEIVTTAIVYTTLTTCPVTNTVTPANGTPIQQVTTTISTITSTSISTVCTKCVAPIASTPAVPPASSVPIQQATSVASPASTAPAVIASSAPPAPSVPVQQTISVVSPASSAPAVIASSAAPAPSVPVQQATSVVSPASSTPAVIASSIPPAPIAPGILPSCVKTWVTVTKCKSNSDYDCYCQDDRFTQNVFECISSWEQDQAQQQAAFSYYAGICAQHVPAHPAIITAIPSTITLVPQPSTITISSSSSLHVVGSATPAPTSAPAAQAATPAPSAATLPPTTISISTTLTLPCSGVSPANQITDGQIQASGSVCKTTSLLQTAVTVPQVAFTTGASSSVGLQAGPAPAQAAATNSPGAAPGPIPGIAAGSSSAALPKITGTTQPFTGAAAKAGPSSVVAVIIGAVVMALFT